MTFSVIICTYNPDPTLLKRVMTSVLEQDFPRSGYEIIVVDNNSEDPVSDFDFIKEHKTHCLREKRQGLAFARISGVRASLGENLVFVDDDNIIEKNYLKNAEALFGLYPGVAVWGPGKIDIAFPERVPLWVKKNYAGLFQEKNRLNTEFGCVAGWPEFYPSGSGMIVKRTVFIEYAKQFEAGHLTLSGRNGAEMTSAEDSQILWTAVKMGLSAGTSPQLKLVHVIPAKRTNLSYLASLNEGISSSYYRALTEMFPQKKNEFTKRTLVNKAALVMRQLIRARGNPLLFYKFYKIENSWFKGIEKQMKSGDRK